MGSFAAHKARNDDYTHASHQPGGFMDLDDLGKKRRGQKGKGKDADKLEFELDFKRQAT